ncbi:tyrosine-type recombinase/integrase [Propionivibrio sp.]|uniref:tyrosine-type recombinase/integrase n=1 Tax=Propionivibrio sp. TaxID=2212460 RepID=UPI003BF2F4F6
MTKPREIMPIPLTDKLLNDVDFQKRVVGISPNGTLKIEPTPEKMTDWFIRDAVQPGFAARITGKAAPGKGEGIQFYAQRKLAGRPCKFKLGDWPNTSLKKAREAAVKALGLMANGHDPNLEKKKAVAEVIEHRSKNKLTFGFVLARDAINRADADAEKTKLDRADVAKWMGDIIIWRMSIHDINAEVLQAAIEALREKRGDASAVKCWRYARAAWNRLPSGEAPVIDPFSEWQKSHTLPAIKRRQTAIPTDEKEGKDWLKAVAELRKSSGSRGFPSRVMADYIILVLCWGARRGEAARLKIDDVDFEREFVIFRDTKNKRDHVFPLTPGCVAILKNRIAENQTPRGRDVRKTLKGEEHYVPEWVFPSVKRGKHLVEPRSALGAATTASGLKIDMHDLRRTFAGEVAVDVMGGDVRGDFGLVKLALNHADMAHDVTQGYIMIKAKLKMLRSIYEAHERRIFNAAGLHDLLPKEKDANDLEALIAAIKQQASDPTAMAAIKAALG